MIYYQFDNIFGLQDPDPTDPDRILNLILRYGSKDFFAGYICAAILSLYTLKRFSPSLLPADFDGGLRDLPERHAALVQAGVGQDSAAGRATPDHRPATNQTACVFSVSMHGALP
jgi:hypothetical protein